MNAQTHTSASLLDSHQHFWRLDRGDYGWLKPELDLLYRDFEPEHLIPLLHEAGVSQTVLVQAAPTLEETRFLLSLAEQHEFIAGVVGWIDFEDASAADVLDNLCRHAKFLGVRPMVQDLADPQWLLRPSLAPTIEALIAHDLTFDALLKPLHLHSLLQFCTRYPQLTVILDHAAKPDIAGGEFSSWAADLKQVARNTEARCKLSGLVTEANGADPDMLAPFVEHVLDCFGPRRIMWGSDWPVCESVCSYRTWLELSRAILGTLAPADRDAIFGDVARETYRIENASHIRSRR